MPALPSVPNVLRLVFPFAFADGGPIGHVRQLWRYTGGPPSVADGIALANDAMTLAAAHLAGLYTPVLDLQPILLTDLSSPTGADVVSTSAFIPGTNAGGAMPQESCTVVNYHIPRRYRGGHPKEYWPFGDRSNMADELHWDSGWATAVFNDLGAFLAGFIGSSSGTTTIAARVNVSFYEGFTVHTGTTGRARNVPVTRSTPLVDDLTLLGINSFISQQRRRRGKV